MHAHAKPAHRVLCIAIAFILSFAIIEGFGGWWAGSLALMGDAGHMASDSVALGISAFAAWFALKPPSDKHTYGLGRAEVIAAWFSSLLMIIISLGIIFEAFQRFHDPSPVKSNTVIIIASLGLITNLFVAWLLSRGEQNLNTRAAILHVAGDALGSLAALASGIVIHYTGWLKIDPILSIVIAILILFSSIQLLRETFCVLMEGVPAHIDLKAVAQKMMSAGGVKAVHDLHIWTLSSGMVVLSAHIDIDNLNQWESILPRLAQLLRNEYHIEHITLQPEPNVQVLKFQPIKS